MRASATHGAVTPIAMSPNPAGQANRPGRTPCAWRARKPNPPALQAWIAVKSRRSAARINDRNAPQPRYAATNRIKGTVAPRRIGKGGVSGGRTNAPFAPKRKTSANQMASTLAMNGFTDATPVPRHSGNLTLITHPPLPRADKGLEQLVKVGLGCFYKHAPIATDGHRPLATRVGPALLGHPVHLAQLRERASQCVEQHRNGSAELSRHRRHLGRHVHLRLVGHQFSVGGELASGDDTVNVEQFLQCCCHVYHL